MSVLHVDLLPKTNAFGVGVLSQSVQSAALRVPSFTLNIGLPSTRSHTIVWLLADQRGQGSLALSKWPGVGRGRCMSARVRVCLMLAYFKCLGVCVVVRGVERQRDRDREKESDRERKRERKRARQRATESDREREKTQRERETDRER